MDDSAYYAEVARYGLVYPAAVVVPMGVLTVLRPDLGRLLLIAAAVLGGLVFGALGGDAGGPGVEDDSVHFQRSVSRDGGSGGLNAALVFGIGLFVLAGLAFVVSVVVR